MSDKELEIKIDAEETTIKSAFDFPEDKEVRTKIDPKPSLPLEKKTKEVCPIPSSLLIELCGSINSDVNHLGLEQVKEQTITYVDNDNKSVLLVNKYLIDSGRQAIPIIAPAITVNFLYHIDLESMQQGDIILYAEEDNTANLGILISVGYAKDNQDYKILTTSGDTVIVKKILSDSINKVMR